MRAVPGLRGRGFVKTPETVCYEIFREVLRQAGQFEVQQLLVLAHPDVIERLLDEESAALGELEEFIGKPIRLQAEALYLRTSTTWCSCDLDPVWRLVAGTAAGCWCCVALLVTALRIALAYVPQNEQALRGWIERADADEARVLRLDARLRWFGPEVVLRDLQGARARRLADAVRDARGQRRARSVELLPHRTAGRGPRPHRRSRGSRSCGSPTAGSACSACASVRPTGRRSISTGCRPGAWSWRMRWSFSATSRPGVRRSS